MYSIYVHTTPDGRKYVGSTSLEPIKRFGSNGCGYRFNKKFYNDILLFGWNNIQHQVLETVEDKETALKREEYYTLLFRSNEPEFGYNIHVGNIQNEDTKNKKSEKLKGRKQSEESKKKRSESLKEFYKNKVFSEDEIKKLSEIAKKPISLININTKDILKFDSQRSCAKFFCVSTSSVSIFIKDKHKSKIFADYKVLK